MAIDLGPISAMVEGLVMLDTVQITRRSGDREFDEQTGQYVYGAPTVLYTGPGAVVPASIGRRGVDPLVITQPWVGETSSPYNLLTPLSAPLPERDDEVTVVEVHTGGDQSLLGRVWRCQDPGQGSTLPVVRMTPLDQVQQSRTGA